MKMPKMPPMPRKGEGEREGKHLELTTVFFFLPTACLKSVPRLKYAPEDDFPLALGGHRLSKRVDYL